MRSRSVNDDTRAVAEVPWLARLAEGELTEVMRRGTRCTVAAGRVLAAERTPGREAFVVLAGRGRVTVDGRIVATVGPGEFVGEMAMLDQGPRSATVVAETEMQVLAFDPRSFSEFVDRPVVARALARTLARRLRWAMTAEE